MAKSLRDMTPEEKKAYFNSPPPPGSLRVSGGVMTRVGHTPNSAQSIAKNVVKLILDDASSTWDRAFGIGAELSKLREACEDPSCGYKGKNPDMRYGAAVKAEILCVPSMEHIKMGKTSVFRYRLAYEAYGKYEKDLKGKVGITELYKMLPARFDDIRLEVIDDIRNGVEVNWKEVMAHGKKESASRKVSASKLKSDIKKNLTPEEIIQLAQDLMQEMVKH